jgi:hypothetical protein
MSPDEVQPISGSRPRGASASNSKIHVPALPLPDCMALRAGL